MDEHFWPGKKMRGKCQIASIWKNWENRDFIFKYSPSYILTTKEIKDDNFFLLRISHFIITSECNFFNEFSKNIFALKLINFKILESGFFIKMHDDALNDEKNIWVFLRQKYHKISLELFAECKP